VLLANGVLRTPSIGPSGNRFDDALCYILHQFAASKKTAQSSAAMSVAAAANLVTGRKPRPAHEQRWGMPIPSVDQSLAIMLLPTVLSLIAGSCDIITFIGLGGLFTAHITGNLVVLVARVVAGDHALTSYILSVPVFVAALALTTLFAALLGRAGMASLRPLLILQLLLLSGCFLLCVASGAPIDPTDGRALTAGMLAVSGMAVQNAIVQVSTKGMPSTAVMTTNISRFVADFIAVLTERNRDLAAKAAARTKHTAPAIVGFAVGCGLGAGCEIIIGLWALALPTGLAFLALVIGLATKLEERP
jgi:uncharacterized membrane protein YoaK (UPF0700 family)